MKNERIRRQFQWADVRAALPTAMEEPSKSAIVLLALTEPTSMHLGNAIAGRFVCAYHIRTRAMSELSADSRDAAFDPTEAEDVWNGVWARLTNETD
jgi:hypothetical protein